MKTSKAGANQMKNKGKKDGKDMLRETVASPTRKILDKEAKAQIKVVEDTEGKTPRSERKFK